MGERLQKYSHFIKYKKNNLFQVMNFNNAHFMESLQILILTAIVLDKSWLIRIGEKL